MRSRGKVQRTHICTNTNSQALTMNTTTLMTLPITQPSHDGCSALPPSHTCVEKVVLSSGTNGRPVCQPPRNKSTAIPLTANIAPYSAMKKNDQRSPLYSV